MPNAVQNVGPGGPENGGYNYDYNAQPQNGPNYDSAAGGAYQGAAAGRTGSRRVSGGEQPAESAAGRSLQRKLRTSRAPTRRR